MNTKQNLETRLRSFSPHVVTLLVLVVVLLALGGSSVQAQTATDNTATTTTTTTTTTDNVTDSSLTLVAKGTVNDPSGAIPFTGNVFVTAKRVVDATNANAATPPVVVLDMDLSGLKGTTGSGLTQRTYITGDNHASEIRPFQATDTIIVSCPYYDSTKDGLSARTMLVTATLNFDATTGKLTSGSITIGNNVVTSAAVGTTAAQ